MKSIKIYGTAGPSEILINERLDNLKNYLPVKKPIIITDKNVKALYGSHFPECRLITINTGEEIKTLETVKYIYQELTGLDADRSSFIVGIGGGIVCDIAGFVGSTYMRGLRFGFVSTTLLSQVDASVGGKNGVNLDGFKNMIGVFNQPEFVICDLNLLKTLPKKEILCGFAEIVKHAAIADHNMFRFLEEHYEQALSLEIKIIEKLVYDSVIIKSEIVNRDEKEKGERIKLNFGHTFGHAIEKITTLAHGLAVGAGMLAASALSVKKGLLSETEDQRLGKLLKNLGFPVQPKPGRKKISQALKKDKKRRHDLINFVLLSKIGNAVIKEISIQELSEFWE
jgi:3-dehydroquinate synthase